MADRSKTTLSLSLALIAALSGAAFAQSEETTATESGTTTETAADNPADASPKPGIAGGHSQAAFIASYDKNGDGKVSLEELIEVRTERFRGADKDGDGRLNEAEYVAEFEGRLRQQYADQGRDPSGERFEASLKQAGVRFALIDRDRDGFLSLEEDLESARKTFARNDTDGDGFVSAADPAPVREDDGNDQADKKDEKKDGAAN
ncbi:hypothetical protein [Rhodobacter sp. 24-YEA-8]|uniref:hypothetical protein n=1 Tax=Rhodobacter sp. 24-YEA-8 TaxID=1884310 RepID=UPI00089A36AD|nr:hypothetical protein [Rhodobacter sp. 24-YEA-8]SEC15261.1 EF hand [Rhodobacter sp. 24-YEA-8]